MVQVAPPCEWVAGSKGEERCPTGGVGHSGCTGLVVAQTWPRKDRLGPRRVDHESTGRIKIGMVR